MENKNLFPVYAQSKRKTKTSRAVCCANAVRILKSWRQLSNLILRQNFNTNSYIVTTKISSACFWQVSNRKVYQGKPWRKDTSWIKFGPKWIARWTRRCRKGSRTSISTGSRRIPSTEVSRQEDYRHDFPLRSRQVFFPKRYF